MRPTQTSIQRVPGGWGVLYAQDKSGREVRLATYLHPLPRLRMSGSIYPLPHTPSWWAQGQFLYTSQWIRNVGIKILQNSGSFSNRALARTHARTTHTHTPHTHTHTPHYTHTPNTTHTYTHTTYTPNTPHPHTHHHHTHTHTCNLQINT